MYREYNLQKVINFIQDFGCTTDEQLQVLFGCKKYDLKSILNSGFVTRKGKVYVYNNVDIDEKMLAALDVLKKYKGKFKYFTRGFSPVYIRFLANNLVYNVIVTEIEDQEGIVNCLNSDMMNFKPADKYILLFKNMEMFGKIKIDRPYIYCLYPPVRGVKKDVELK